MLGCCQEVPGKKDAAAATGRGLSRGGLLLLQWSNGGLQNIDQLPGGGSGSSAGVNFQPCQRRRPSEANGALCCMVKNTLTATMEIFSRERPQY